MNQSKRVSEDEKLVKRVLLILCSVILLATSSGVLHAGTVAVGFSAVDENKVRPVFAGAKALGFKFMPTADIDVFELGIYSNGKPIPAYNHDKNSMTADIAILKAGLYDKDKKQLGIVEINNSMNVENCFRWAAWDQPVHLKQGEDYYVMAEVGLTEYIWDPNGFFASPEIRVLNGAYKDVVGLSWLLDDPDVFEDYVKVNCLLGANFKYEISEVPVPSALWLLGSGCLGLIGFGRKHLTI